MKRVLDIGNCDLDHGSISAALQRDYQVEIARAHGPDDAFEQLRSDSFDLVLVNRKLDQDYSDGLDIIKAIKADAELAKTPVMLITNYPEHQATAVAAGAEPGFGKKELALPETHAKLAKFLK